MQADAVWAHVRQTGRVVTGTAIATMYESFLNKMVWKLGLPTFW